MNTAPISSSVIVYVDGSVQHLHVATSSVTVPVIISVDWFSIHDLIRQRISVEHIRRSIRQRMEQTEQIAVIRQWVRQRRSVTDSVVLPLSGLQNHKNGSAKVSVSVSIWQCVADRYWRTLWRTEGKSVGKHLCRSVFVILDTKKLQNDGIRHEYSLADPLADHCNLPGLLHLLTEALVDVYSTDIHWRTYAQTLNLPMDTLTDMLTDTYQFHRWTCCTDTESVDGHFDGFWIRRRIPWRILWRTQNPWKKMESLLINIMRPHKKVPCCRFGVKAKGSN